MSRRWRYPRSRRGDFFPFVPAADAPVPPAFPPPFIRARVKPAAARRGRFFAAPAAASQPVPWLPRERAKVGPSRRGRFLTYPISQVVETPPAYPPQWIRERVRVLFQRRGRFYLVPLVGAVAAETPHVPDALTRRRRPAVQTRPGMFLTSPPAAPYCPRPARRVRPVSGLRRRTWWQPPRPQVVPPTYPPTFRRTRSRIGVLSRRGRFAQPPWVGLAPVAADTGTLTPSSLSAQFEPLTASGTQSGRSAASELAAGSAAARLTPSSAGGDA